MRGGRRARNLDLTQSDLMFRSRSDNEQRIQESCNYLHHVN